MFDLEIYQDEYAILQKEKFPFDETRPYRKLIGAVEELGEIGHEFLRYERYVHFNMQKEADEAKLKMSMEIGDTINFLTAFCNIVGIDISEAVHSAYNKVSNRVDAENKL